MRTRISVFLITLSGLVLEVGLTRIYSASVWYHFAFVAISVALLGWGLGGFTVHLLKQRMQLTMNSAALLAALYATTIPLCLWVLARYPFEMDRLPLYFLAPLLPFFLAGMTLSIIFDLHRTVAGALYFADLLGAAIGAILVTFLLHWLGGETALLTGAIAPAIAAVCLLDKQRRAANIAYSYWGDRRTDSNGWPGVLGRKVWNSPRLTRDYESDASPDGRGSWITHYTNGVECLLTHRCG